MGLQLSDEEWRAVVGYEGHYEVSDRGRLRSLDRVVKYKNGVERKHRGKVLKLGKHKFGYLKVELHKNGKISHTNIHRLVLEAFEGPCPDGMEACHNDGNPTNNTIENLRWGTRSENRRDAVKHGTQSETARTHCPRGHRLADPNLMPAQKKVGKRSCLACSRARARVRHKVELKPFLQEVSDEYYAAIIGQSEE